MEYWQLKQLQALPLEAKIHRTLRKITEFVEYCEGSCYVSYSGGKDSTVLLHLVLSIYPNIPAVFCDTGNEHWDIYHHIKKMDNLVIVRPKHKMKYVLEKYGYPIISKEASQHIHEIRNLDPNCKTVQALLDRDNRGMKRIADKWFGIVKEDIKISHKCCDELKKSPLKFYEKQNKVSPIIGTTTQESRLRQQIYLKQGGCNVFLAKRKKSAPISIWTSQDVLKYIDDNKLPLAKCYGEVRCLNGIYSNTGEQRTGCVFCLFGAHRNNFNRIEEVKRLRPKLYDYYVNELGFAKPLEIYKKYANIKNYDRNQITLF